MNTYRDEYTINIETRRKIKIGSPTWKRLAARYNMIEGKFIYQPIPDSRAYLSNKVPGVTIHEEARKSKHASPRKRVDDLKGELKYLVVGSKAWNERFLEYEWNGHEFGEKRNVRLPEFMNTVEKRC